MTTATPSQTTTYDLTATLARDFRAACAEHSKALELRATKDSRDHRAAEAESLSRIDALLDMYLVTRGAR